MKTFLHLLLRLLFRFCARNVCVLATSGPALLIPTVCRGEIQMRKGPSWNDPAERVR
ncbi:MAG: hypothetical protein ACYDH9_09175 [Limisphaerales bacterium]